MAAVVVRSDHGTLEETRARAILPTVSGNSPHQMFGGENKQFGGEKKETPGSLENKMTGACYDCMLS